MSELKNVVWRYRVALWSIAVGLFAFACDLGGSFYEHLVIDPAWPDNPSLIQPEHGGVDRKRFWIPLHGLITLALLVAVASSWTDRPARKRVLAGAGFYVVLRVWTFAYFVPLGLRFESAGRVLSPDLASLAEEWVSLSLLRLPLVAGAAVALLLALRRLLQISPQRERAALETRRAAHAG